MLQRWKLILTNWINCYFQESNKKGLGVNLDSLLGIISQLRESLNGSKLNSSLIDVYTIQEFIVEKYPDFKFDNGGVDPENEEDVYFAASLLLFFVCLSSKNVDLKNAMCNELSPEDQETILKFSKHLMECPRTTFANVQAAIIEACGQDKATPQSSLQVQAVETPPAIRSYHSEVRRLQAALDAEIFDRNYLQEELNRTNQKVEKLLKDKEQYKLQIVELKAQISLYCSQDSEPKGNDVGSSDTSKLVKQLEQLEQQLLSNQEQLEDVQCEKETLKSKLNQLKAEHEKLLVLSQQECTRASSLAEELETERRQTHSLRELVAELQQHNHLNRMDSSLLECDDPDASIHNLLHNTSSCSEVCANVIEVQLGEERAKIVALKQQMQLLQEQLCEITKRAEEEKQSLRNIISEKEISITDLACHVTEQIKEKNTLKEIFDTDVAKLNNELNELEQRLKGCQENSRNIIEKKMHEIQNLQEEKLSLLQSMSNESTKLQNIIIDLQREVDAEKSSKIKLRDEYDNHIMRLNEKVLNRNNELVELQNKIFEKGETIEALQLELRREKELREELTNKHNTDIIQLHSIRERVEQDLQQKSDEAHHLHEHLQHHISVIEQLNKENNQLKITIVKLQEDSKIVKDTKEKLLTEIENRDIKAEQIYKETENLKNLLCEKERNLQNNLEESAAKELQNKLQMQNELQTIKDNYLQDISKLNMVVQNLTLEREENEKLISKLNKNLTEQNKINDILKLDLNKVNTKIEELTQEIIENNNVIKVVKDELELKKKVYHEDLLCKDKIIESIETKLASEVSDKNYLQEQFISLEKQKEELLRKLNEQDNNLTKLECEYTSLCEVNKGNENTIQTLQEQILKNAMKYTQLENDLVTKVTELETKLMETEKSLRDITTQSNDIVKGKESLIYTLNVKAEEMETIAKNLEEKITMIEREKQCLIQQLTTEKSYRYNLENEYVNQYSRMNSVTTNLNEEILRNNKEISSSKSKIQSLLENIQEKNEEIKLLEWNITQMSQSYKDLSQQKDKEINDLVKRIFEMGQSIKDVTEDMSNKIHTKMETVKMVEAENSELRLKIENITVNSNEILHNNNCRIQDLQQKVEISTKHLESCQKHYKDEKAAYEKFKAEIDTNNSIKDDKIRELTSQICVLNETIEDMKQNEVLLSEKDILIQELLEEKTIRKIIDAEKQTLLLEKSRIEEQLANETKMRIALIEELECNMQQLAKERLAKKIVEEEKDTIACDKEQLQKKYSSESELKNKLDEENHALLTQIEILTQQVIDKQHLEKDLDLEKSKLLEDNKSINEIKTNILTENKMLKLKLTEVEAEKESLKSRFEASLSDEIKLKKELEQRNVSLLEAKDNLARQITEERAVKEILNNTNKKQLQEMNSMQHEIHNLHFKNSAVKNDVVNLSEQVKSLTNEKNALVAEKESLLKSLNEIKSSHDALMLDVNALTTKLCELNENYSGQLKEKQEEIQKLEKRVVDIDSHLDECLRKFSELITRDVCREELDELVALQKFGEITPQNKCESINRLASILIAELAAKASMEKDLRKEHCSVEEIVRQKELQIENLQKDITSMQQYIEERKLDFSKLNESLTLSLEAKNRDVQMLQHENQTLLSELNDVKVQLDTKVHSLKDKLIENEHVTDKLKKTYECQIDNLNMMINKLTNYLKDKSVELDSIRKEQDKLQEIVDQKTELIKSLEEEIKVVKHDHEKMLSDFESERLVLKNMVTITESVMDDQKLSLNKIIVETSKTNEILQEENKLLQSQLESEKKNLEKLINEKEFTIEAALKDISALKQEKLELEKCILSQQESCNDDISKLNFNLQLKMEQISKLTNEIEQLNNLLIKYKNDVTISEEESKRWKVHKDSVEAELTVKLEELREELMKQCEQNNRLESSLQEKIKDCNESHTTLKDLHEQIANLNKQWDFEKSEYVSKLEKMKSALEAYTKLENEFAQLKDDNQKLVDVLEAKKTEIVKLESLLMYEKQQNKLLQDDNNNEQLNLKNKCDILQEYQSKAEQELESRQKEIELLSGEVKRLLEMSEKNLRDRDELLAQVRLEKDNIITDLRKELIEEREKCLKEAESKAAAVYELRQMLEDVTRSETDSVKLLRKENEILKKTLAIKESSVASQEKASIRSACQGVDARDRCLQVDNTPTDHSHSSLESYKTISDLERILQDRNRTITSLQSDIKYLKSLMAESEVNLLDVRKDLEVSKENCQQLSSQLKKTVHQKNEEIADLKKQLAKMSMTENRASQIIKVSAKYQAIILKRIAEIKSNTVLKELTNFGNSANCENELRRSLNAGPVTMEDLEHFLDTTDRHLKRCSEKMLALQKERDRLSELNRINDSEIINMKKFLTELSVSIKTFNSVKELYTQKMSRVVSLQRTVRREILSLDGKITDATMCKLQRDYASVMQDLTECAMNLERWVERSVGRAISVEKIKQALASEERSSMSSGTFQNTSLEIQFEELENYFCKILEEVARAQKGDGAKDAQSVTVTEVRAEYEDKLNRMKAKMKQLYQEQIGIFKEKQREEIVALENELQQARDRLEESSRAYEEHIRALTTELWNVGEKFLVKKDEADWLRRRQHSGSLMSLQHVHSSGLLPPQEEPARPSDAHSLRSLHSLPANPNTNVKNAHTPARAAGWGAGRGAARRAADADGEVFDNGCLRELDAAPRLGELRRRNSLRPPHLRTSYPAETQFAVALHEDHIKCMGGAGAAPGAAASGRSQRKEVGITAYKKPGPPTPSKQAGRLSATDSELRESLREAEPGARRTGTPSRLRALFRSARADAAEGTPRSRRLSNIFRKK